MLDTDISSYIIKNNSKELMDTFVAHQNDMLCISVVTYAELWYGVILSRSARVETKVSQFLPLVRIIDWNDVAARRYAEIKNALKESGALIGNMDMLIAAAALAREATLVTNNERHFRRVRGLKIENWLDA